MWKRWKRLTSCWASSRVWRPIPSRSRRSKSNRSPCSRMEIDLGALPGSLPAADAVPQLGAQAEGVEGPQLQQGAQAGARLARRDRPQGLQREGEQPPHVGPVAAVRRQAIEELEQVAPEREADGIDPQSVERFDQAGLVQAGHGRGPAQIDLDAQVVEEVQRAGEAADAAPGALGDGGEDAPHGRNLAIPRPPRTRAAPRRALARRRGGRRSPGKPRPRDPMRRHPRETRGRRPRPGRRAATRFRAPTAAGTAAEARAPRRHSGARREGA